MPSQQHNPHLHHDTTVYEIGKGVSWLVAAVFLLMLALPPLWQNVTGWSKGDGDDKPGKAPLRELMAWKPGGKALIDHLHTVEGGLDQSGYSTFLRQRLQEVLTAKAGEGNRKVFVGFDGWLFYQPDLKALTGFGPLKPEPFSVMKDPELAKLPETRDVIEGFAKQLKERGIELLLVPVPLKPMIYPEYVSPEVTNEWITHPDAPAYYEELRKAGIGVLDMMVDLAKFRSKRKHVFVRVPDRKDKAAIAEAEAQAKELNQSFLMQDTHWTPEAMRLVAEKVAAHIKQRHPEALQPWPEVIRAQDGVERRSLGDLVKLIDLKQPEKLFDAERGFLRVIAPGTLSRNSPVVLLGDSFVNIFDDPTLGFDDPAVADGDEKPIRAGFAQHLSLLLQQPLDVIAMNGRGATGVRQAFARRFDDEVRAKKLVVWVIAARDVLLSRTAAHQANIEWAHVTFNANKSPLAAGGSETAAPPAQPQQVVVEAVLSEKSENQELNGTPYRDALHAAVYEVEKVLEGTLEAKQVVGIQWTFRNKVMQPTADFVTGGRYRLTLTPWDAKQELHSLNLEDGTTAFDAERWFVEKAEEVR